MVRLLLAGAVAYLAYRITKEIGGSDEVDPRSPSPDQTGRKVPRRESGAQRNGRRR
ncbi:hypothetical protein NKI95_09505 [Mesorhizobium sp. M0306]|uniref:hypothetical protein n=1 Tax=Mesorhizobium sp. M0306 TaxID=2956932 RepID=UPI00333B55B0